MRSKYKSEALEALHETVSGLHKIGLMSEDEMHFYDEGCLVKPAPAGEHSSSKTSADAGRSNAPIYARGK